jgi:SAM-dependent MidA family methyltransferase
LDLPGLSEGEAVLLREMRRRLAAEIAAAGGALPFDRYMETALYAPGLGYYMNQRSKLGEAGDFVTAPEVSALFGRCVARQVSECLHKLGGGDVLEVGAGSGRLAADLLLELEARGVLPGRYCILELSPSLKQAQRETLQAAAPHLLDRVHWLGGMPLKRFSGVLIGNELLDAMPVHRFRRRAGAWQELAVSGDETALHDAWGPVRSPGLARVLDALWQGEDEAPDGYSSEVNMRLAPWLRAVAAGMTRGYLLLIDYGYTRREYYHPERRQGTLLCHFRHRAYADPYRLPGLQDMTANVDFTALAQAAVDAGFALAGYTTQAHFLIDSGLDELLHDADPDDVKDHLQRMQGVKKLTLPSEMGERFKVMALAREADPVLSGFRSRDLRDRL